MLFQQTFLQLSMQQTIAHQMNDVKQTILNLSEMVHNHRRQHWTPTDFYTPRFGDINISVPDESLYIILECHIGNGQYKYLNNFGNWTTCETVEISNYKTTKCSKLYPSITSYKQSGILPLNDAIITSIQRIGCNWNDHTSKYLDQHRVLNDFFK